MAYLRMGTLAFVSLPLMRKLIRGFGYAFKGIGYAIATQLNFRVHLVAALTAGLLGYALHISAGEWIWVIFCIALVLAIELLNTAIEILTDMVSPAYHVKAGRVKDAAAGAVLVAALFALVTGLIIFLPKILNLIHAA